MAETLNEQMDKKVGGLNEQVEMLVERTRRPRCRHDARGTAGTAVAVPDFI